ncbi:MAG: M23 family metallopeptidase [Deltaproteobacteria bacterium]|nr:M23 family metallopeptidase [Candidatus Anaeroferrophillus wilburensis]MBN2889664.1 M23 family metallopeptidase [Deltaproteobacteria bacterium]
MKKTEKYTIVLLRDGNHHPRRISLSRTWLRRLFLLLFPPMAGLFIGAVVAIFLYASNLESINGYEKVVQQAAEMEAQVDFFSHRIEQLTDRLAEIKESNAKIKVLANLEAHAGVVDRQGIGGPDHAVAVLTTDSLSEARRQVVERMHRDLQTLELQLADERQESNLLHDYLEEKKTLLNFTPSVRPVRGWVSSKFGYRISPFTGRREFHHGVDIVNRKGTPVIATADGRVKFAGVNGGYGKMVVVDHGTGVETKYGHLSRIGVKVGEKVVRGQEIGLLGNSGRSTGPHLHYEVVMKSNTVNPVQYFVD